jgi:Flp pilus assembly protein TadD
VHEGNAYYALNRCPAAMSSFQRALQADPHSALAEVGLGRCLLKTDPHAAEQAFMAAVQDDPANANAYNDLGIARDLQGNFAGAVGPYQQALRANPALTAAEVNLGLSLALSGRGPEALQYLGPLATSQTATPKIRQDYAAALVASGRADEARQVLAVDLPPDQVNQAMAGFSELIAASLQNQPPPPPPPPTVTHVQSPPVTAAPITPAAPVAKPTAPPVAAAAPAPLLPATTPVAAAASPSPSPIIAMGGSAAVQLGALDSQAAAERQWRKSVAAEPALFNGKAPDISTATVQGKTYYRLRVTGFGSRLEAAKFCAELSAANMACTPANF